MKKFLICFALGLLSVFFSGNNANAQDCDIALMVYLPDQPEDIPLAANTYLLNQITKVAVANGVSASDGYAQFLITPRFTVLGKSIQSGPPRLFVYEFDVSLYIGDYLGQKVFASTSINLKGIGSNETKAYLDAIKKLNPESRELQAFVKNGKDKIVDYYNTNYPNIIKKAQSLATQKQFEEALFYLSAIPECSTGYAQALKATATIYQQYVDNLCNIYLARARSAWNSQQDRAGAEEASEYLAYIYPDAACYKEAQGLHKEIKSRIREEWDFQMKMYNDAVSLEKQRINAWKEVGVAFGKGQRDRVTNVYWIR